MALVTGTDGWGRPLAAPQPPVAARRDRMTTSERWVWVALRGLVFVPGALFAMVLAANLGYFGQPLPFVLGQLSLAPAALVCWILASGTTGGDRWTAGYLAVWTLEIGVLLVGTWLF